MLKTGAGRINKGLTTNRMQRSSRLHRFVSRVGGPVAVYAALALVGTAIIIAAVAPLASTVVQRWSQRDVELRSRLVFTSIRDQVAAGLASASGSTLVPFFDRIAEDERLLALGFCSEAGLLENATKRMPSNIRCNSVARTKTDTFATVFDGGHRLLVSAFPLSTGAAWGHLIILHDLHFVDERAAKAQFYAAVALLGVIIGIGLLATAVVLAVLRGWSQLVRSAITDARRGIEPEARHAGVLPVAAEMRSLLRDLRSDRREGDGLQVQWSPQTLHRLLEERLPGTQVIAVSNREPYIHNRDDGSIALQIPGEWSRSGPRTGHARVRRHVDRPRQRFRRSGDGRCARSHPRAAERPVLHVATRLAERGGAGGLLLWPCERGPVAVVPYRLRAPDVPAVGLAAIRGGQPAVCRCGRRGSDGQRPNRPHPRLPLCASAADDTQAAARRHHPDLLAHPLAQRRDVRHLPLARGDHGWAARAVRSSAFIRSSTATTFSRRPIASWRAGSIASKPPSRSAVARP